MKVVRIDNLDDCAIIKWRLSDACNYQCPYCIRKPLAEIYSKRPHDVADVQDIIALAEQMAAQNRKLVKVDLIGGEPTVLSQLPDIIKALTEHEAIEKVNITSNFSKPVEWWKALPNPHKITATMSYHPTQTEETATDFVKRVSELNDVLRYVKAETVQLQGVTHLDEFVESCEKYGVSYMVEGNLLDSELKFVKRINKQCSPRYAVTWDDGSVQYFDTRNSFLKEHADNGAAFPTEGFMCTRDVDYVYVEYDSVSTCKGRQPLKGYQLQRKPHICYRTKMPQFKSTGAKCTLCGNMSIFRRSEEE